MHVASKGMSILCCTPRMPWQQWCH